MHVVAKCNIPYITAYHLTKHDVCWLIFLSLFSEAVISFYTLKQFKPHTLAELKLATDVTVTLDLYRKEEEVNWKDLRGKPS